MLRLRGDTPAMLHRLRVLNAVLVGVDRFGCRANAYLSDGRYSPANELHAAVMLGQEQVSVTLAAPPEPRKTQAPERVELKVSRCPRPEFDTSWADTRESRVEEHLADIVTAVIVVGEADYRDRQIRLHELLVKRKAELHRKDEER